ncbi:hypothetical protein Tco_1460843, partial [Tanacetum coccineum]
MSTYLKHMAGYKQNQLKSKNYDEIQKLFDKAIARVNMFVELESDNSKKQKLDESVEVKVDDEVEIKKHMEIVSDDEVTIYAIPLATKPPIIIDWKIIKERKMGYFQIIRADGSLRRYSSMIKILQNIDIEDLETLWKLVKAKHGNTRPEEAYERVLWGDLKVMFEPDIESDNLHIFMLVAKTSRILEVFECILLVKIKLLIKKLEDLEDEHQIKGRIVRIKRLHDDLRVNTSKVRVTAVKHNLPL